MNSSLLVMNVGASEGTEMWGQQRETSLEVEKEPSKGNILEVGEN